MRFSANRSAYWDMPSLESKAAMSPKPGGHDAANCAYAASNQSRTRSIRELRSSPRSERRGAKARGKEAGQGRGGPEADVYDGIGPGV